jgi:hypothetical protein
MYLLGVSEVEPQNNMIGKLLQEQSGVLLDDDLIVLVVLKCHNLVNCMILTSCNDLIKDALFLFFFFI